MEGVTVVMMGWVAQLRHDAITARIEDRGKSLGRVTVNRLAASLALSYLITYRYLSYHCEW
jgi:hypothetical protein